MFRKFWVKTWDIKLSKGRDQEVKKISWIFSPNLTKLILNKREIRNLPSPKKSELSSKSPSPSPKSKVQVQVQNQV